MRACVGLKTHDSVLELTARHWWTIVASSVFLLGLTGWLIAERPKSFIPTEDQGYLIVAIQTPDGTSGEATQHVLMRVESLCRGIEGIRHTVALEGLNVITSANQTNCGVVFLPLTEWSERSKPELRAVGLAASVQQKLSGRCATPQCHGSPAAADPRSELDGRIRADG